MFCTRFTKGDNRSPIDISPPTPVETRPGDYNVPSDNAEGEPNANRGTLHPQVSSILREFSFLMLEQLPMTLPPQREIEHSIELLLGQEPPT